MEDLGARMKGYENVWRYELPQRMPIIIRVDGKAFHSVLKGAQKPFDDKVIDAMNTVAIRLLEEVQGALLAYIQSDEISLLINNYSSEGFQPWFGNNLQKITSVTAAIAATTFSQAYGVQAYFDSRAFILPKEEVVNYFIWRQQDWERNSVQMLARSLYSHKQCENKNTNELQDMCWEKEQNWNDLDTQHKRGRCVIRKNYWVVGTQEQNQPPKELHRFNSEQEAKEVMKQVKDNLIMWQRNIIEVDLEIPIFTKDRNYINCFVNYKKEE